MSQVIPFRPYQPATLPEDVASLSARLLQVETAETSDEDLLDLLLEAELAALGALARSRATTLGEAVLKLATLVRRIGQDRDGPLCEGEIGLLRSTLRDLQRLSAAPGTALQA
ncbi:hypothetical protein [Paracraurococcus lichenis]|uniref:Uncharacterized protein n=1 Tax=Paracraurococcus lichenis TaxID=3064888 RepID=A0ABT9DVW8_9PROT|nr:hypothetical protein [Paracraurococcus sp. LOR1-02]MDO9708018.1 hypothetical protein [Paracraurococcus sp. LOR1-02]